LTERQIFLHGPLGRRQYREVLGSLMASLVVVPDKIYLVSPWLTDFFLLDNRSGFWDAIEPSWGSREIRFSELIATAVNNGSSLRVVVNNDGKSQSFINHFENMLGFNADYKLLKSQPLHTKGILTRSFFLKGSMNYTASGASLNEEHLTLTCDPTQISEALLEFSGHYEFAS
jgi:hypothetical protein